MKNNSNTIHSRTKAIIAVTAILLPILILMIIGRIINLSEPKCIISGCNYKPANGSEYCYAHKISAQHYRNPDYSTAEQSEISQSNSSDNSSSSASPDSSVSKHSSSADPKNSSSSSRKSSPSRYISDYDDSYDDGYDDVYGDGEPDWDRYDQDEEYAMGADDAMDEYEYYRK